MDAPTPAPAASRRPGGLLTPGFAGRLGLGLGVTLLAAYALLAGALVQRPGYVYTTDFLIVLTGADILQSGHPTAVYDAATQAATQAALLRQGRYGAKLLLPFNHPPFEMLLFAGLRAAGLSDAAAFGARTLISLLALVAAGRALAGGWPIPGRAGTVAALALFTFFPVLNGLLLGQNSAGVLLGWAAGSAALRRRAWGWAGLAFALLALKPQLGFVLLGVLLLAQYWRTLGVWLLTVAGAVALTLPILGLDWPLRYGAFLVRFALGPPDAATDPAAMQNWRGLATHLLGPGDAATALTALLTLASGLVILWLWWKATPHRPAPGSGAWDRRWTITLLLALLISPHLLLHDFALAIVPGWMLAARARATGDWRLAAWLGIGWTLGLVALYRALPVPLTVLWVVVTAGWLLWQGRADRSDAIPRSDTR
jgi:hypothetical protein